MGLFNKFKKENNKSIKDTNQINNSINVNSSNDSFENNIKEMKDELVVEEDKQQKEMKDELNNLKKNIEEKNQRLNVIVEKIELSKKEYNEIIGKIIRTKKELRSQENSESNKVQVTKIPHQNNDDILKVINASKIKLENIQKEIRNNSKINEELEEKIRNNKPIFSDIEAQKKKVHEELRQREKELEVLKKKLTEGKNLYQKNNTGDESKSVVEAASQIVATTNKRLQDTMKELDVIRQLLDKERKAHNETKKKLQN